MFDYGDDVWQGLNPTRAADLQPNWQTLWRSESETWFETFKPKVTPEIKELYRVLSSLIELQALHTQEPPHPTGMFVYDMI